jgi:replication fork clamp-binding protein CrfC
VGLNSLKSLNLTNVYPNNNNKNKNNNKVKSKPLEVYELVGKKQKKLKHLKYLSWPK